MAKTGEVTGSGGNAPLEAAVIEANAPVLTLGQIVALALTASSNPMLLHVDLGARTVAAYLDAKATTASGVVEGVSDANTLERLHPDADAKVTAWTGSLNDDDLAAILNPAKPAKSLASLLSGIEDSPTPPTAHIYVDQVAGKVVLIDNAHKPTLAAADETFTQTVQTASGAIRNAFE